MELLLFQSAAEQSIWIAILKATLPGIVVAVLGLITPQIRNAVFYKRAEYDFEYDKNVDILPCVWDIQWEGNRLTIEVAKDISNDKIEGVTFVKDEVPPGETVTLMRPSDSFRPLFDKELYVKLNSIIRFKSGGHGRKYTLRFVLRRKILRKIFG